MTIIVPGGAGQTRSNQAEVLMESKLARYPKTMADHRIRLRGAWDRIIRLADREVSTSVNLPIDWPLEPAVPFRLERGFGRPPLDPLSESLSLEFLGVPGLVAARIDDRPLDLTPGGVADWLVPLTWPLRPRNRLVLEIDPGLAQSEFQRAGWGKISLLIASGSGKRR
jgi:hypothetical protein